MKYPVWLALVLPFGCSADEVGESESASKTGSSIEAAVLPEREVLYDGLRYMVAVESRKEPVKVHFASVLRKLEE